MTPTLCEPESMSSAVSAAANILPAAGTLPIDFATAVRLLAEGDLEELGVIPWSSNYALLVRVRCDKAADVLPAAGVLPVAGVLPAAGDLPQELYTVYKPRRGERPLWDFPAGTLYLREYAAFLVSQALGWMLVPPTVLRKGSRGPGTFQVYIDSDPEQHYFNVLPDHADDYRRVALFDVVINNADRKAGHCLLDASDHIWSIDHGICFHVEPKLRTVIWDFAGEPIPHAMLDDLNRLSAQLASTQPLAENPSGLSPLGRSLTRLLHRTEVQALRYRLDDLIAGAHFPYPDPNRRNHPWPPI